ncbi:Protein of unknown function [Bacillus wiedmannii]|uniref:Uncharacterized protein n=1 Tax=Bacillus wiedmannii TaxID=1890302 RepID=A0A1C4FDE4_9BACI|nr:Protein of unknown function [Bacillus wiedmannii]
MTVGFTFNK